MTLIGKIVKSNSHTDYVCQIYAPGEVAHPPGSDDYVFGTFVRVSLNPQAGLWLVGLIYDTVLLNPEFGRLGPRLSPPSDLAVFSPDYLNEKVTLVGIQAIGMIDAQYGPRQGFPASAPQSDARVERMTSEQICEFHTTGSGWSYAYIPLLMAKPTLEARVLVQRVLGLLQEVIADTTQCRKLALLMDSLDWQTQIGPLGGRL